DAAVEGERDDEVADEDGAEDEGAEDETPAAVVAAEAPVAVTTDEPAEGSDVSAPAE
ncbi:MAG: hypothetical protein V7644_100, partial [Actinomycetota bacterium]